MVQINFALKEVNCKIVYYGPGMSGKTTNLEVVHRKAPTANKGELTSIATEGDRTLFFDFMPLDLGNIAGMRTKFQLYTVPGQVYYNSTRKLVLQGVDGIIFVADSQEGKMDENIESMENLRNNLSEYGKSLDDIPMVLQYNKRDLPGVMDVESLDEKLNPRKLTHFEAVATTGEGVFPTLKALSAMVLESLSKDKRGAGAVPRRRPVAAANRTTTEPDREAVAASTPAATTRNRAPAASTRDPAPKGRRETFGPESDLRQKVEAAKAQATSAPPRTPGTTEENRPPARRAPESANGPASAPRIRKGADAFLSAFTPPPEAPANDKPAEVRDREPPVRETPAREPATDHNGRHHASDESSHPSPAPRRRAKSQEPMVQKFVLEDERGSPLVLIALIIIILVAAGVILYSFKVI